uniref:Pleckstrin homology domain containing, family M (with RUN domain) member 1 n=1 Tax=Salarias fasciatus TaxID=181472 RepID=A0A672H4D1_SALFA
MLFTIFVLPVCHTSTSPISTGLIKERLAQSLKALQKRYVTSDAVVTSEDGDANLLCCALEAIFIHGIKSKYIRSEAAGRSRKVALPQPFFWSLLKTVTHRYSSARTSLCFCSSLTDLRESGHCSQDSMPEDSLVSSSGADQFSETALFSSSDSEIQGSSVPSNDPEDLLPSGAPPDPEPPPAPAVESADEERSPAACESVSAEVETDELPSHSHSWISEDDIYKPHLEEVADSEDVSSSAPAADEQVSPSPPSVVHRRQIGLSNPFRGLLKLGHLERRGAMGMWRDYYCELSPFEFRLYVDAEERTCCDNCSLLRCEDACVTYPEGRFELAFSGKRLYLRAANRDEAEDWVDRIVEAVNKCRPAARADEQWERRLSSSDSGTGATQEAPPPSLELDWNRTADLETDAIKEAVLYCSVDSEARTWTPMVFSLSLEALKGFKVHEGRKLMRLSHPIGDIRDVVPDVSLGGPAFFKLLTVRETLRLRAENPEEARSWRALVRGALDSYLESGEDGGSEEPALVPSGLTGNLHRLVQHRLKEDGVLLAHLCTVPSEKGLDAQSFKCAGCPQQIGPSRGRARLCEFSGRYYCDSCHTGETTVIPSRMVHNWDLTPREVSVKAVQLLAQVEQEPLLNLEQLNPELVKHSESMAQAQGLRQKLRLLGDYLLTCRSGACKTLQARMGQRTYLLESSQLYSVLDLRQIAEGQYAHFLLRLLHYASSHVFQCDLCTQRGFFCQICHSNDIIFPFQLETTTRCKDCKAVFHLECKPAGRSCPRCERMKKYLERDLQD